MINKQTIIDQITKEVVAKLQGPALNTGTASSGVIAAQLMASPAESTGKPDSADGNKLTGIAKYIDHTLLKPEATAAEIDKLCKEAAEYHFYSVCINTNWVSSCAKKLRGTGVKVCAVVGFPLGAMDSRSKGFEARHAVENGAQEIDMVINVGAMKSGDIKTVESDIKTVRRACRPTIKLKVILETALLSNEEKIMVCQIASKAGADFVKTSTGFSSSGATIKDVALMRRTVGIKMGVKASGGINSFEEAMAMVEAGATRIGTSSGVAIITG